MRHPYTLLSALLPLLLVAAGCASQNPADLTMEQKLGGYLERALQHLNDRNLDAAQQQCLRALDLDPENERFLLILGNVHLLRGQTEDILIAERIFRDHPAEHDYRVHLGLGEALERLGVLRGEAADAIRAGERFTDHPDPAARADELEEQAIASWREARSEFEAAEEIHQGEIAAVNGLIRTNALLGSDEESIRWAFTLIEILEASSLVRRTELEDVGIEANRERELRKAIRDNGEMLLNTRLHIASLYRRLGRLEEAVDELGEVIALEPELPEAYSRRAQLYVELGQHLRAKESIEHYLSLCALPYEDPRVQRAFALKTECETALARGDSGSD